jgi:DNA-binding response OmpR family regulator
MYTILVADDEKGFRAIVRLALERVGYAVEEAADGREGVDKFARTRIDLAIVDLQMPGQAGVETIGLIRELNADVPIIAVSGFPIALEDALVMGANLPLTKPFSLDELLVAVRMLLARDG